ncbi:MAG TPA: hypothetical protein VGI40_09400 [Pirellulaceae bacterium]|jgi:hypothetical protein
MTSPLEIKSGATLIQQRQWFIASRWQEYEGEARANLLRIVAIGAFYVIELLRFYGFEKAVPEHLPFHRQATLIAVAWTMVALAIWMCLRLRIFPAALKYVSTACDILLLTSLAALNAPGPFSPLVLGYFLIVALAALRFNLGLVWFATVASMLGYWSLVGLIDKKWFDADHAVPPTRQLITLFSLALTGIVIGQVIRRVRDMASDYAQRLAMAEKTA